MALKGSPLEKREGSLDSVLVTESIDKGSIDSVTKTESNEPSHCSGGDSVKATGDLIPKAVKRRFFGAFLKQVWNLLLSPSRSD